MLFAETHNLYKAKRALCKVSSMLCVGQTVAPVERVSLVRQRCHLHAFGLPNVASGDTSSVQLYHFDPSGADLRVLVFVFNTNVHNRRVFEITN